MFLARGESPAGRLFRLKTWHRRAPAGFLPRFRQLQRDWLTGKNTGVKPPIARLGGLRRCPWVLSNFQQGVPLVHRVQSGQLRPEAALALLTPLIATIRSAHARGLAHAAIVPGNVIVRPAVYPHTCSTSGYDRFLYPVEHARAVDTDLAGFVVWPARSARWLLADWHRDARTPPVIRAVPH